VKNQSINQSNPLRVTIPDSGEMPKPMLSLSSWLFRTCVPRSRERRACVSARDLKGSIKGYEAVVVVVKGETSRSGAGDEVRGSSK
jgi:hypothetical protein